MKNKIKYIGIKEFREKGYLQEVNRRFLHTVGLALEISEFKWYQGFLHHITRAFKMLMPSTAREEITGVWDSREDPLGYYFDFIHLYDSCNPERITQALLKQLHVEAEIFSKREAREKIFGNDIEPIPATDNRWKKK